MKKNIARGASLILMTLIVFTLVLSICYATEADTGRKWTIENNVEKSLITIDTNYEEYTVTIENQAKENIDKVFAEITVGGHTEKTDYIELTGFSRVTIHLKDYFSEQSLKNQEVKINIKAEMPTNYNDKFPFLLLVFGVIVWMCYLFKSTCG